MENRLTDLENEFMAEGAGRKMGGRDGREFGLDRYTLLYVKWITNKDLFVEHMRLCSMLCCSLDGRGVWGKIDTCVWMIESLAVHLKLSPHC